MIFFHHPEGGAAVGDVGEVVEGSGGGEELAFLSIRAHAGEKVGEGLELALRTLVEEVVDSGLGKAFEPLEAEAEEVVVEDGGFILGMEQGNGLGFDAVAFGILEEGGDGVESHRLVVEEAAVELDGAVGFEPAGGVGDEREGDGVGFGESVKGERADGVDHFVLDEEIDVALGHAGAEFGGDSGHAFVGTFEGHRATEFIGFRAIESGDDHGHAEDLFLEKRDAEGAGEDGFEGGMDVVDGFFPSASVEVGVDEVADDGARADDGDFDRDVIEGLGLHDGKGCHLRAGLDLEGADGVGLAEESEGCGVVFGNLGKVDRVSALGAKVKGVFHGREHAEAEEVDFDDAEIGAVVLVPLHDGATGHAGWLERDDGIESGVADDHAA